MKKSKLINTCPIMYAFAIVVFLVTLSFDTTFSVKPADIVMTTSQYKAENHLVTTNDGYILTLTRIVNPLLSANQLKRPVLFVHGWFWNSIGMLQNPEGIISPHDYTLNQTTFANGTIDEILQLIDQNDQKSMALLLSNSGYDVFLVDLRGNRYSKEHVNLSYKTDTKYWDFSLDDHALIDIPATIDYIQKLTGAPKIGYVGYSMGTFVSFALLTEHPEYSNKIEPIIELAPVSYVHYVVSIMRPFCEAYALQSLIVQSDEMYGPFPFDGSEDTSSTKILTHWGQLMLTNRFGKFDYRLIGNLKRYGSLLAPNYNLGRIRSKSLVLFYGDTDTYANPLDVKRLINELKVEPLRKFHYGQWNHEDPFKSSEAGIKVNLPSLQIFEKFQTGQF